MILVFFFLVGLAFFLDFFVLFCFFVFAFFNLCKHDGDEERLCQAPRDTSVVLGCECSHTHTGIDNWR